MMSNKVHSRHRTSSLLLACAISFFLGTQQLLIGINEKVATGAAVVEASAVFEKPPFSNSTGWHSVDVFYGDSRHVSHQVSDKLWTSQANQDQIIFQLLGKGGFFVDLAANHAMFLSNTFSLETHYGWNGLCIEANPKYWLGLAGRRCHVVGAVVGNQTMEEIQFKYGTKGNSDSGLMGGIVNPAFDNNDTDILNDQVEPRFTVTLETIFRRYKVPPQIDYLSLDVEGAEMYIMSSFPFDRYRMKLMTVERPKADLMTLLQRNGYILLSRLTHWGETLWCHESIKSTLDLRDLIVVRGKRKKTIVFNK